VCVCVLVYVHNHMCHMALQPTFKSKRQTESIHTVHSQSSMLTCSD